MSFQNCFQFTRGESIKKKNNSFFLKQQQQQQTNKTILMGVDISYF